MPGVWTWGFGEGWGHHYLDSVAVNHNAMGRGYETFGNGTAETLEQTLRSGEERDAADKPVTSREWYRPWPPDRKFKWSMRNNTNYMQTGCLAILDYTARNAPEMLRGFYRKSYNSWQKGVKEKPFAFAIAGGPGRPPPRRADGRAPAEPPDRSRARARRRSRLPKAPTPPAPSSSGSISPTATTRSTC